MNGMMEPEIRFEGYDGEWRDCNLEQLAPKISSGCSKPSEGLYNLYGSTGIIGTTAKGDYFGDMLLIARVGANAGGLQLVNENCGITDNTLIIKPTHNLTNYIYFFLQHYNLNRLIFGSGQPLITGGMLKKVNIRLGNRAEQSQIASYFKSLDVLIQSATKKIASLKQLKSASLISMFPQEGEVKPRVRFKGFKEDWKNVSFIDITYRTGIKNGENLPLESYSISNEFGFIPQNEQFENGGTMFSADKRMYYIVSPKSFAYNPARINVGSLGYYNGKKEVIVSSLYEVFKTNDLIEDQFLLCWFKTDIFQKMIEQYQEGGVRLYFFYDKLCKCTIKIPSLQEQRQIASFFCSLDKQISLETQRLDKFKQIKSACLDKMFV